MRAALLAGLAILCATAVAARPVAYRAPPETASLPPGPGADVAFARCAACHSVDYITTQPRKLAQPTAFWTAEVAKMKKAYGAKIDDDDAKVIIAYLAGLDGK